MAAREKLANEEMEEVVLLDGQEVEESDSDESSSSESEALPPPKAIPRNCIDQNSPLKQILFWSLIPDYCDRKSYL